MALHLSEIRRPLLGHPDGCGDAPAIAHGGAAPVEITTHLIHGRAASHCIYLYGDILQLSHVFVPWFIGGHPTLSNIILPFELFPTASIKCCDGVVLPLISNLCISSPLLTFHLPFLPLISPPCLSSPLLASHLSSVHLIYPPKS